MRVERLVVSTRIHKLLKSPFRFSSQGSRVGALVTLITVLCEPIEFYLILQEWLGTLLCAFRWGVMAA